MLPQNEIINAAIASTLLLFLFALIIILAIVKYQNRRRRHLQEVVDLKSAYKEEILKAQLEARENTLNHVSQEIHDNVGQVLSLAKLNLGKALTSESTLSTERIASVKDLIGKAIQDLRTLSKTLNNQAGDKNVVDMIRTDADLINQSDVYRAEFYEKGTPVMIPPQQGLIVYRIIQEAVSNVLKHAQGNLIVIGIEYRTDKVDFIVKDNGIGYDPSKVSENGSGLRNMKNRARLIGGEIIQSKVDSGGTMVQLSISL